MQYNTHYPGEIQSLSRRHLKIILRKNQLETNEYKLSEWHNTVLSVFHHKLVCEYDIMSCVGNNVYAGLNSEKIY